MKRRSVQTVVFPFASHRSNAVRAASSMRKGPALASVLLSLFLLLTFSGPAHAYRPFTTEDAGVAGKGVFQAEMSWDYLKGQDSGRDAVFLLVPIVGVTENLELSAEIPYQFRSPFEAENENGIGDVNLVAKYQIVKETENVPAVALKGLFKTNSGNSDRGLGSGDKDYGLFAAVSKTIGKYTIHGMFGYTVVGDNGDENIRNIYSYGVALDYELTDKFHLCGEVTGNRNPDRTGPNDPLSGLLGATFKINEKIVLDGGVRYGFTRSAPDWSTTVGMTFTF